MLREWGRASSVLDGRARGERLKIQCTTGLCLFVAAKERARVGWNSLATLSTSMLHLIREGFLSK